MLKDFYSQPGVVARLQCGPLTEQLDLLVSTLQQEGYARDTIRISIRTAAYFSRWLERRKYTANDVTDTLVDRYLSGVRRYSSGSKVFLKACPPFTPFTSAAAIGHIAKRAMHRGGITVHHGMAAHTFRHTVASEMVNKGATFKDVADVLGHRSLWLMWRLVTAALGLGLHG